jgi:endonuclease YncB( thermonuclease family)
VSEESPSPKQPSRLRQFWNRRSRKGKAAIIIGILFALFLAIGALAPAEEEAPPTIDAAEEEAEVAQEPTTTEPEEEETTEEEPEPPPPPPLLVARIIDGDTLELDNGERVRLVQIDAPETKGECYAQKSTQALRTLLPAGTEVRIVRDRRLDNRDQYDRLLRYVVKGKRIVNLELVRRGAASVWFYRGERGRLATRLVRAVDTARAQKRGAWGACIASTDYESGWNTRKRPPKPPPQPPPQPAAPSNCHPSYVGACLDRNASDYDCAGGEGDGPKYTGFVRVVGPDDFGLDRDGDGLACESS